MRSFKYATLYVLCLIGMFGGIARADVSIERKIWYEWPANIRPTTLKAAIMAEKDFLGTDHPDWKPIANAPGLKNVCAALNAVHLTCDYNTRGTISMFLTVNGKGLFPASGGTNPYHAKYYAMYPDLPDDGFIGTAEQNKMLCNAVLRNAKLFKDGDLRIDDLKHWK